MKKILLSVLLLIPLVSYAKDFGATVPQWEDFAPSAYVDVKEPKRFAKFNLYAKYWYERRVEFESELDKCKELESNDDRASCYENLKVSQYQKNTEYNARIEARQSLTSGIPEMTDRTDSMIPINTYIDNFTKFQANEIK